MNNNFAYQHAPLYWQDIVGQEVAVKVMQNWVSQNALPNFLFLTGDTGIGKTSLAKLLIRSSICRNRKLGEYQPCGHCATCRHDPIDLGLYNNVHWVTANNRVQEGEEKTYQRTIVEALQHADRGPARTNGNNPDTLFLVFEEWHLMPQDLAQRCLARADAIDPSSQQTMMIFISMSPEKVNPKIAKAIAQRGAQLHLRAPSNLEIASKLADKFKISRQIADLIAVSARNSVRGAYSLYKDCLDFQNPLTIESVEMRLSSASPQNCSQLWLLLADKCSPTLMKEAIATRLSAIDRDLLISALLQDLEDHYQLLGESIWWAATNILYQLKLQQEKEGSLSYALLLLRAIDWPPAWKNLHQTRQINDNNFARVLLGAAR